MIPISPALIKYGIGIAAIAAIFLYAKSVISERDDLRTKYSIEKAAHQEAANTLLSERIAAVELAEKTKQLEYKFNEINEQARKYADCVAKRNCYVSLRTQSKETSKSSEASSTSGKADDSSGGIDIDIQQNILYLRASIETDELKIKGLQDYINTYCYKPLVQ